MHKRLLVVIFSLAALSLAACGGGGGGGTTVIPSTNGGNGTPSPPPSEYPQHYTTDLDGIWWVVGSDVHFSDPQGVWTAADRAEIQSDITESDQMEFRNGSEVIGTLPLDTELTENRVSKLSDTQYELVQRGVMTISSGGETATLNIEIIASGYANASRTLWEGSAMWNYWGSGPGGTVAASISFDFVATKD